MEMNVVVDRGKLGAERLVENHAAAAADGALRD